MNTTKKPYRQRRIPFKRKGIDFAKRNRHSWRNDAEARGREYHAFLEGLWELAKAPRQEHAPTVISTFAGGGGSSLGYHMAGFNELMAVEWDAEACMTLRENFPDMFVHEGDVGELTVENVFSLTGLQRGELDVFDGSPPCQGFSTAGKRRDDDPRNRLFEQYIRLLRGLAPKVMIMENVTGLTTGKMKPVFFEVVKAIEESGYKVEARILVSSHYGAPQNRRRVIFVGVRHDLARAGFRPAHPKPTHVPLAVGHAMWGVDELPLHQEDREMLLSENHRSSFKLWKITSNGDRYCDVTGNPTTGYGARKLDPARPSFTLVKNDQNLGMHGTMHWEEKRRLTRPEAARLSGFPDGYVFEPDWAGGIRQMGNCVPPPMAYAVACAVRDQIIYPFRLGEPPEAIEGSARNMEDLI